MACMLVRPSGSTPASSPSMSALFTASFLAPATTVGNSAVHSFVAPAQQTHAAVGDLDADAEPVELELVQPVVARGRRLHQQRELRPVRRDLFGSIGPSSFPYHCWTET